MNNCAHISFPKWPSNFGEILSFRKIVGWRQRLSYKDASLTRLLGLVVSFTGSRQIYYVYSYLGSINSQQKVETTVQEINDDV